MVKTLILFILMLSVIVIIHEGGHFLAAKAFGVYCHEFSIGMGPKIFSKKGKETTYSVRALPLGGFVAMAGDNENELETKVDVEVPANRTLTGIAPIKRIVIMSAGIIMNLILAFIIMSMVFLSVGQTVEYGEAIVDSITVDSPAYKAEIKQGDKILKVTMDNGYSKSIDDYGELSDFLSLYDGSGNITLKVLRNNEKIDIKLKPQYSEEYGRYLIGVSFKEYEIVDVNLSNCFKYGFNYLLEMTSLIFITLAGLFRGTGLINLSGPIGVYEVTSEAVSYGFTTYLSLIATISLNIGIFNALPLPVFDGGRIVLTLVEMIRKKPLDKKLEQVVMSISVIIVLMLFVFTTFKDIFNLFN